jgi:hypothetical protein
MQMPEDNDHTAPTTLVPYKHQDNLLLSMNNYTPLVISRNDKYKQLTLLSQRKLALTAINKLCALQKSSKPQKI